LQFDPGWPVATKFTCGSKAVYLVAANHSIQHNGYIEWEHGSAIFRQWLGKNIVGFGHVLQRTSVKPTLAARCASRMGHPHLWSGKKEQERGGARLVFDREIR